MPRMAMYMSGPPRSKESTSCPDSLHVRIDFVRLKMAGMSIPSSADRRYREAALMDPQRSDHR